MSFLVLKLYFNKVIFLKIGRTWAWGSERPSSSPGSLTPVAQAAPSGLSVCWNYEMELRGELWEAGGCREPGTKEWDRPRQPLNLQSSDDTAPPLRGPLDAWRLLPIWHRFISLWHLLKSQGALLFTWRLSVSPPSPGMLALGGQGPNQHRPC